MTGRSALGDRLPEITVSVGNKLTFAPKVRTLVRGDASLSTNGPSGVARRRPTGTRPVVGPSTPGRPLSWKIVISGYGSCKAMP